MEKIRNSNVDIARMAVMALIIFHHLSLYGVGSHLTLGDNSVFGFFIFIGKMIAPFCNIFFVLLLGYFASEKFKFKKFFKALCLVLSYYYGLELIFAALNGWDTFNPLTLFSPNNYWFAKFWLIYLVVGPPLIKVIKNTSKKKFFITLSLIYLSTNFIPLIIMMFLNEGSIKQMLLNIIMTNYFRYLPYFMFGVYMKYNNFEIRHKLFTSMILLIPFLAAYFDFASGNPNSMIGNLEKMFMICSGLLALIVIKAILEAPPKYIDFVNILAPSVFSVYLLHEHWQLKCVLWNDLFNYDYLYHPSFAVSFSNILFTIGSIFFLSLLIDAIRRKIVKKILLLCYTNSA